MLSFDLTNVKKFNGNFDSAWVTKFSGGTEVTDLEPMTKGFVFWGGVVGITRITESNAADYYARSKVIEKFADINVFSEWSDETNGFEPVYMTPEMVYEMIGLSTNHSQWTTAKWFVIQQKNMQNPPKTSIMRALYTLEKHNYNEWLERKEL